MKKVYIFLACCLVNFSIKGQQIVPNYQPYGKIDMADLEMKGCDFEKNAGAEVLFDVGIMTANGGLDMERHTRIKIFNDQGKSAGTVRLEYFSYGGQEGIAGLKAETVNLENGKMVATPLDKKFIYNERINLFISAITFAMPNIKPGSIIEFEYREYYQKVWYFQSNFPTRYSELQTNFSALSQFRLIPHVSLPYAKSEGDATDIRQTRALANVPSLTDEPYMTSRQDNLQRMEYVDMNNTSFNTWPKIGEALVKYENFGGDMDLGLSGENVIIKHAKTLKNDDEKIAYIFDTVKNTMKWNKIIRFDTKDGTVRAWNAKTGNSAEINLILYHLLKKSGIRAMPMVVSTKNNGKLSPVNADPLGFNKTVVYIPVDSAKNYVLDASNKYNIFNVIPYDQLNTFGLSVDEDNKDYKMVFMGTDDPAIKSIYLNAEIKASNKMEGTAQISNYTYNRIKGLEDYAAEDEKKYTSNLKNDDNNLKITAFKMDNLTVDSLPLVQNVDFSLDLAVSDDNYIYFNPNQLTGLNKNPFLSGARFTDIDFGYRDNMVLNGVFKLPPGYKVDALPKNITMSTPDASIIFRRSIIEQDGTLTVRYVINHKKTIYFKDEYPDFHEFYKKLYEMLNEQVVLKKS